MRILLIQTAFTGDVILATAMLETLHQKFPDAQIDFLLRKGNESLFAEHPYLRHVLIWDKKKGKYSGLLKLLRKIRTSRYDMVVNCQRFLSSGILTAFSGASQRIGFTKNPLSRWFTRAVPHDLQSGKHEVERNHDLIRDLTGDQVQPPKLYPPAELPELPGDDSPYVCLAPTSVWYTKQWPANRWISLINALPDITVFLIGGPADQTDCEYIRQAVPNLPVYNMAGKLNLLQSARLMAGARMNYVNDSAPTHLASAVNAPVATIYCSTVPTFGFTPLSDNARVFETTEPLECRPCGLHGYRQCPEGHFRCSVIEPERIVAQTLPAESGH